MIRTSPPNATLTALRVEPSRVYVNHGPTGANRARPDLWKRSGRADTHWWARRSRKLGCYLGGPVRQDEVGAGPSD